MGFKDGVHRSEEHFQVSHKREVFQRLSRDGGRVLEIKVRYGRWFNLTTVAEKHVRHLRNFLSLKMEKIPFFSVCHCEEKRNVLGPIHTERNWNQKIKKIENDQREN